MANKNPRLDFIKPLHIYLYLYLSCPVNTTKNGIR